MAGQYGTLFRAYKIMDADGVALYTGVVHSGDGECKKPTADNQVPLGVVDTDERINDPLRAGGDQTGRNVTVTVEGYAMIRTSGAINVGDRVILGAGGVAKAMPTTPGTYNVLGFAEKSATNGDVIPVRLKYHVFTVA